MTIYSYDHDDIESANKHVGWLSNNIYNKFECMLAVRDILHNHGHAMNIKMFYELIGEYKHVTPVITDAENGYYIRDQFDEKNYAYFSKDMKCAKSCAKAVLKVMMA